MSFIHGRFVLLRLLFGAVFVVLSVGCRSPYVSWSTLTADQDRAFKVPSLGGATIYYRVADACCGGGCTGPAAASGDHGGVDGDALAKHDGPVRDNGRVSRTLLFVHGAGPSKHYWRDVAPLFEPDYRVVMVDLLGSGRSTIPSDDVPLTMQTQGKVLRALMDHLGGEDWVLIGLSYGGGSSLEAVRQDREAGVGRVKGLVVAGAPAFYWELSDEQRELDQDWVRWLIPLISPNHLSRRIISGSLYQQEYLLESRVLELAEDLSRPDARATLVRRLQDLRRELTERRDDAAYFRAVDCPVLLLWGREDSVVPLSVMRQLASRLPSVRRVCVLDHCGHSMFTECAGVSVRCVRSFLRSLH